MEFHAKMQKLVSLPPAFYNPGLLTGIFGKRAEDCFKIAQDILGTDAMIIPLAAVEDRPLVGESRNIIVNGMYLSLQFPDAVYNFDPDQFWENKREKSKRSPSTVIKEKLRIIKNWIFQGHSVVYVGTMVNDFIVDKVEKAFLVDHILENVLYIEDEYGRTEFSPMDYDLRTALMKQGHDIDTSTIKNKLVNRSDLEQALIAEEQLVQLEFQIVDDYPENNGTITLRGFMPDYASVTGISIRMIMHLLDKIRKIKREGHIIPGNIPFTYTGEWKSQPKEKEN